MRFVLTAIFAFAVSGCFPRLEADPDFPRYFTRKIPGETSQARLDGSRLYGAEMDVRKVDDGYRGNGEMGLVDLRYKTVDADPNQVRIEGTIGTGKTEVYVAATPNGMSVRGLVSGGLSHLDLTPSTLSGTIGTCTYDLRRTKESLPYYEGVSRCLRRDAGGTRIALPAAFHQLSVDARGVWLALFLGGAVDAGGGQTGLKN